MQWTYKSKVVRFTTFKDDIGCDENELIIDGAFEDLSINGYDVSSFIKLEPLEGSPYGSMIIVGCKREESEPEGR